MSRTRTTQGRQQKRKVRRVLRRRIENSPGVIVRRRQTNQSQLVRPAVTLTERLEFEDLVPERGSNDERS